MKVSRILCPLAGAAIDADVIRLAATLGKPVKAQVFAIHVIEVRWTTPLDAVLDEETLRGEQLLDAAEQVARQSGIGIETELVQSRTAWSAIIDEAEQRGADLIIMGMPYRRRMGKVVVGRTVQNVFLNAPCQVIALRESAPEYAAAAGATAVRSAP